MGNKTSVQQDVHCVERVDESEYIVDGQPANYWKNKDAMVEAIKCANKLPSDMHYSKLPVDAVKKVVGHFHPVHRVNIDVFRKVIESGSLQSRHFRECMVGEDVEQKLVEQLRGDLRLRALMMRFVNSRESVNVIFSWLEAVAQLKLLEQKGDTPVHKIEMHQRQVAEREERMRDELGWKGAMFAMSENKEAVAVGAAVALVMAGGLCALAGGLVAVGAAATAVGAFLFQAFVDAQKRIAGGGAMALHQADFGDSAKMKDFVTRLRRLEASSPQEGSPEYEEHLWLKAMDRELRLQAEKAGKVRELLKLLRDRAEEHAINAHEAAQCMTGRRYDADLDIGTNKRVFAIMGPHTGHYYGNICIVLKKSIAYHPWFDMSPCAGTGYLSHNAFKFNTWLMTKKYGGLSDVSRFHASRLNAATLGWRSALAAALAHAIRIAGGGAKGLDDITEQDVRQHYMIYDSHCVIEAHMPEVVPLARYVQTIIIPETTYNELTALEKERLREMVDERLRRVDDTTSQCAILGHCFDAFNDEIFTGFVFPMGHWPEHEIRRLPGVQPQNAAGATVTFEARGATQILLGPIVGGGGHGITFALYTPTSPDELVADGFVGSVGRLPDTDRPAEGKRACFAGSDLIRGDGVTKFTLAMDQDGFVKPEIVIRGLRVQIRDQAAGGSIVCTEELKGKLTMQSVAARRGSAAASLDEAEIRELRIQ